MKKYILNDLGLFFSVRAKVLNNFKSRLFPIKILDKTSTRKPTFESEYQQAPESTPETTKATKAKTIRLRLRKEFLNEIKNKEYF